MYLLACTGLAVASQAFGSITVLNDGNSQAIIEDAGSLAGMRSWMIDGVENLALQGFWFRTAVMNQEANIGTLALNGRIVTDTNTFADPRPDTLALQYGGDGFVIETRWTMRGGTSGNFTSDIAETIAIRNMSSVPLVISFFQYSDFDLGGTVNDQSISIGGTNNQVVRQSDFGFAANETVVTPAPTRFEAGFFPSTLTKLNDNVADDLNNVAGPLGPGDLTWAYQWDFVIPAGQSRIISKDKQIVPSPGAVALVGLGGALIATKRRR